MSAYGRIRRATARVETKQFWGAHQTWKHFVPPLVGLAAGGIQLIWGGHKDLLYSLLTPLFWAVCFYVVAWVGTFLINYVWLTPAALDRERQREIAEQIKLREALRQQHESEASTLHQQRESEIRMLRDQLAAEQAKNAAPEIRGDVIDLHETGAHTESQAYGVLITEIEIEFKAYVCNHRQVKTTLKSVRMDGSELLPSAGVVDGIPPLNMEQPGVPIVLERGIGKQIHVRGQLPFSGHHAHELAKIDLSKLKLYVIDGFGGRHLLVGRKVQ